MPQLGETIAIPEILVDEDHDENTCPWHAKEKTTAEPMDPQEPDEDVDAMPANLGTKLGKNLGKKDDDEIWIDYAPGSTLRYEVSVNGKRKIKSFRTYGQDDEWQYSYALQYAPHHLIPGNESLKGSKVVPFLGDENVIKEFKKNLSSKIKDNMTAGYDVNRAKNGEWLPSPYALSMANLWPPLDGIAAVRKRRKGQLIADQLEDFKLAYVAAAISESGNKQFHMRHADYSKEVKKMLNALGERLRLMAGGGCPLASRSKEDGKYDPPTGITGRLDVLSGNLRRLLIGPVWRSPIFTDDKLMGEYVKSLASLPSARGTIDKVF